MNESLRAKLQQSLQKREHAQPAPPAPPSPTPTSDDPDFLFSRLKAQVPALRVYQKFFPGKKMRQTNKGVVAQCFNNAAHPRGDQHPQLNLYPGDGGFYCHACGISGSVIDLAAVGYGQHDHNFTCPPRDAAEVAARATFEFLGVEMEKISGDLWRDVPPAPDPQLAAWAEQTVGEIAGADHIFQPGNTKPNGHKHGVAATELPTQPAAEPPPHAGHTLQAPDVGDDFFSEPPPVTSTSPSDSAPPPTQPAPTPENPLNHAASLRDALISAGRAFVPLTDRAIKEGELQPPRFDPLSILSEQSIFLRPYMMYTQPHFGAPVWHMFSALTAVGLACGRNVWTNGSPVYGNMMVCLVGRVAGGKTSSFEVIKKIVEQALPVDDTDENSEGIRVAGNVASGPALIDAFRHTVTKTVPQQDRTLPPLPDGSFPPKIDPHTGHVKTVETEVVGTRVRVLAEYSELSTLKAKSSADSSTIQQTLMDAYDGHAVSNRTIGRGGETVRDPFCSVMTTTQPDMLKRLISREHIASGFASRITFVIGQDRMPHSEDEQNFHQPPHTLVQALASIDARCRHQGGRLRFATDQARLLWDGIFSHELYGMRDTATKQSLEHLAARNIPLFRKIMLILAVDAGLDAITEDILLRTLALWGFLKECIFVVAGQTESDSTVNEQYDEIVLFAAEQQRDTGDGPTLRDICRKFRSRNRDDVVKQTENLVKSGDLVEVRKQSSNKGGRSSVRYLKPESDKD